MIQINISNKTFFTILAILIVSIFGIFVFAQSAQIPNPGHSIDQISGGWKLLAAGNDWTEEAEITLSEAGITDPTKIKIKTDERSSSQSVNAAIFNWPDSSVSEIMFKVISDYRNFCVGGGSSLSLQTGRGADAVCIDYEYKGVDGSFIETSRTEPTWIRLTIISDQNGRYVWNECPDQLDRGRTPDPNGLTGTYGEVRTGVFCNYKKSDGFWNDNIKEIIIEEADWRTGPGRWEWEIWYK